MKEQLKETNKLKELRMRVEEEVQFADMQPYSFSLVNKLLKRIAKEYSVKTACKILDEAFEKKLGIKKYD